MSTPGSPASSTGYRTSGYANSSPRLRHDRPRGPRPPRRHQRRHPPAHPRGPAARHLPASRRSVQEQIGDQHQGRQRRPEGTRRRHQDRDPRTAAGAASRTSSNKRELRDAKERLRIARQLGTALGIRTAREGPADVQRRHPPDAASRTPRPRSTKGGQFALGNIVTINIHGVTDPAEVARRVDDILKKRRRRTTTQARPTNAATPDGRHQPRPRQTPPSPRSPTWERIDLNYNVRSPGRSTGAARTR